MENANFSKELEPIKAKVSKATSAAEALSIKTADDLPGATTLLSNIKLLYKAVTQSKEKITKPLNEALRNARAFFSPVENDCEKAENIVKRKMIDFNTAELAKAAKKTEVIEKKVEEGKMSFEKAADKIEAITPEKTVTVATGSAQFRTVKEVVIENEMLVPREYLVLDMVKIRKVALAGVEIAGVKVIEKQTIAGLTR